MDNILASGPSHLTDEELDEIFVSALEELDRVSIQPREDANCSSKLVPSTQQYAESTDKSGSKLKAKKVCKSCY